MGFLQTVILGAIAGFTIYLGLPLGRIRNLSASARAFLSMSSAGILFFLLFEIFHQASEPVEDLLLKARTNPAAWSPFIVLWLTLFIGFGIGLVGLIAFERRFIKSPKAQVAAYSPYRLSLMIAGGIGLHNFSEGLAIGQSSAQVQITLATLLVIGFALHNATEGFGIIGPLTGERPSWGFLALVGLIGGGPTLIGSMLGYYFVSPVLFILFLSLAAGALVYVIGEMFILNARSPHKVMAGWGLLAGLMIAFSTELVLAAAGL